jgi:acyl-coenzyme A thioesterase PaaI-like protein
MSESLRTRSARFGFNWFPACRGTGARITYIAGDWREVRVKVPLNRRTRNYVGTIFGGTIFGGTIFGGSIYGAIDPLCKVMLIRCLGTDYVVWDKSATIRFKKPGRTTLYARFALDHDELDAIRDALATARSTDRTYTVALTDAGGVVHATVEKVIYIRRTQTPAAIPAGGTELATTAPGV